MTENLQNTLLTLEKRITKATTGFVIFSIILSFLLYESYSAYSKIEFINLKLKEQIYLTDLERDRKELLNNLSTEYKTIISILDKQKKTIYFENYFKLKIEHSKIVELFKNHGNFLNFEMNETGVYVYPNGESVIKFWEKIDDKDISVKYQSLQNEKIGGVNFYQYYERMNTLNPIIQTKELPYSTLLKMQNLYASYLETSQKINDYFNFEYESLFTLDQLTENQKMQAINSIKKIREISKIVKNLNSKIKITLNNGLLNTPLIDAKKEIRDKTAQNLNFQNLSINFQSAIALSPMLTFILLHWLYMNLSRYHFLTSEIKINEKYITSLFLIYSSTFSELTTLLFFLFPFILTFISIIYLFFDIENINASLDIIILKSDLYLLLLFNSISLILCINYIPKCLELISNIKRNKNIA